MKIKTVLYMIIALNIFYGCGRGENISVKVIYDTDIGNDIDDVLALQILLNLHKSSTIDLLGITISKSNPYTIGFVDGYCRYNGINDLPIGFVYEGPNSNDGKYLKQVLDTIINGKSIISPKITIKNYVLDAWELQRKLLSNSEDNSVIMISVGPLTNLRRLIESSGDQYSPLNGIELINKKVKFLSLMGGNYSGKGDIIEWNIMQDIESSIIVFNEWPSRIVASGFEIGKMILYPHESILDDFSDEETNPLCISYKLFDKMPYDRPVWDLTSVLYAVEPEENYFSLSPPGTIYINSEGDSHFIANKEGRHQHLKLDSMNTDRILERLVETVTLN